MCKGPSIGGFSPFQTVSNVASDIGDWGKSAGDWMSRVGDKFGNWASNIGHHPGKAVPAILAAYGYDAYGDGGVASSDLPSMAASSGYAEPGSGADWLASAGATDPTAYMGTLGGGGTGVGGLGMLGKGLIYGSGLLGMYQSQQMMKLAKQAQAQADPFGPYRAQYAQQLAALQADPSSITSRPGYQFTFDQGNQALQRMLAAGGLLGSGNALVEAQKYGQGFAGQYLTQEEQRLAGLAGANIAPNPGIGLTGYQAGSDMASRALATIGYGMTI